MSCDTAWPPTVGSFMQGVFANSSRDSTAWSAGDHITITNAGLARRCISPSSRPSPWSPIVFQLSDTSCQPYFHHMIGPKLTITYRMLSCYCVLSCLQDCCSQQVEYNHLALTCQMQAPVLFSDLAQNCRMSNQYQICYSYYLWPPCNYCTVISEKYIQSHIYKLTFELGWNNNGGRLK